MLELTLAALMMSTVTAQADSPPDGGAEWSLVYANDAEGASIRGDKCVLISAIRDGLPIRVYWAGGRVEHSSEATLTTVFGGEVFAQVPIIRAQRPSRSADSPSISLAEDSSQWTTILATNGGYDVRWFAHGLPAETGGSC